MNLTQHASQSIMFIMVSARDLRQPKCNLQPEDFTVRIARNGCCSYPWEGDVREVDAENFPGLYSLRLSEEDTAKRGQLFVRIAHPHCHPQVMAYSVMPATWPEGDEHSSYSEDGQTVTFSASFTGTAPATILRR